MLAQVPEAVPTFAPPSNRVDELDVPDVSAVDIPMPVELPVSALVPDRFPAIELTPAQVAALGSAGASGNVPEVAGLSPSEPNPVAPSGIPVGRTGAAGPIPSGEVIPSGDGPDGTGLTCAETAPQQQSSAPAKPASNGRLIGISLVILTLNSTGPLKCHAMMNPNYAKLRR
jgi:hypothetical protein